jgi:hypothetical protein
MNKILYYFFQGTLALLVLFTMGCTKQHSVQVNNDYLTFYYNNGKANKVLFASSTDHFRIHPAIKGPRNIWQVSIPLNSDFTYFYIVDGKVTIPDCKNTVLDDFGSKNCFYVSAM